MILPSKSQILPITLIKHFIHSPNQYKTKKHLILHSTTLKDLHSKIIRFHLSFVSKTSTKIAMIKMSLGTLLTLYKIKLMNQKKCVKNSTSFPSNKIKNTKIKEVPLYEFNKNLITCWSFSKINKRKSYPTNLQRDPVMITESEHRLHIIRMGVRRQNKSIL